MREMPYGQWVAFDGPDSVHDCGQTSEYGPVPANLPKAHEESRDIPGSGEMGISLPGCRPVQSSSQPAKASGQDLKGWPAKESTHGWLFWIVVIVATVWGWYLILSGKH